MHLAIKEAQKSGEDVPVGAVLMSLRGEVIASGHNRKELLSDPTSHAEVEVIRAAGHVLGDWRLTEAILFVTLEPCVMCAGAIVASRIPRVVFGSYDHKLGAAGSAYDLLRDSRLGNPIEVTGGVLEEQCSTLLEQFFASRREA